MTTLELAEFDHDSRMVEAYLDLVERLNAGDPRWIAPTAQSIREQLGPYHPFYQGKGNRFRRFALRRVGKLVGHVLATVNRDLVDSGGRVGALGFFEVEPDYELFRGVLDPAVHWLKTEAGARQIWATMNFDIWHGYRMMTRGFSKPAFFGEPRNPRWLPEYFKRAGFIVKRRWISTTADRESLIRQAPIFRRRYESLLADGYRFERLRLQDDTEIAALHRAVDLAFGSFYGYTPISPDVFKALVVRYLRTAGTELTTALLAPDGALAGFGIAFPDPFAPLQKPASPRALYYMLGVPTGRGSSGRGLGIALHYKTLRLIIDGGYEHTTFALMAEESSTARYFGMAQEGTPEREYVLFQRFC